MSVALVPVITRAGLGALANAQGTGILATITQISVGRGVNSNGVYSGYTPAKTATALVGEMIRLPLLSGQRRDPIGFTVLALLPGVSAPDTYPINEVGFHLADGTLLAVWSDPTNPLAYKTKLSDVELGFDLSFEAIPVASLAISVLNPDVPDPAAAIAEGVAMMARLLIGNVNAIDRFNAAKI